MPSIVYSEEKEPFTGRPVPYDQQPAVRHWARHYANWLYLSFIKKNSDDRAEVRQAEHELRVCQQRMDHWQRHANWSAEEAAAARAAEDAKWRER